MMENAECHWIHIFGQKECIRLLYYKPLDRIGSFITKVFTIKETYLES